MAGKGEGKTAEDKVETTPRPVVTAVEGSAALDKVKGLMKHPPPGDKAEDKVESKPKPAITADEGAAALDKIKGLMKQREKVDRVSSFSPHDTSQPTHERDSSDVNDTPDDEELEVSIFQIDFLTSFYGIKEQEAVKIIKKGHESLFEEAAQAMVPIPVILEVLLQHVPYLKSKKIPAKTIEDRVLDVLFAHLGGIVREDEIFKCLVFATKEPAKSIEIIAKDKLIGARKEQKRELREKIRPKREVVETVPKVAEIEIDKSIIQLSKSEQVGYKAKKEDSNCRLSFYQGNNLIESTLVSSTISSSELEYMLAFETNLPINEDYDKFIEKVAPIIHETIQRLFDLGEIHANQDEDEGDQDEGEEKNEERLTQKELETEFDEEKYW
ncbi:MAG: hypothetical protein ACXAEU_18790 [Candidatus Hodarchaeales archaeon]